MKDLNNLFLRYLQVYYHSAIDTQAGSITLDTPNSRNTYLSINVLYCINSFPLQYPSGTRLGMSHQVMDI